VAEAISRAPLQASLLISASASDFFLLINQAFHDCRSSSIYPSFRESFIAEALMGRHTKWANFNL
jgi:hypothetical protein